MYELVGSERFAHVALFEHFVRDILFQLLVVFAVVVISISALLAFLLWFRRRLA